MIEICQFSGGEEEEDCDDGVYGQKLYTSEPVRLTVAADLPGNDNGNRDMVRSPFYSTLVAAAALAVTLIAAGCHGSSSPNGVYIDGTGRITLEFKDGKAYMNLGGLADTDGTPYDVNGDKITIHYPSDGMMAAYSNITINSDGTLQSGMGTFKKK